MPVFGRPLYVTLSLLVTGLLYMSPTRCCQQHRSGNITLKLSFNDFKAEVKLVSVNSVTLPADILKASDIMKNNDFYVSQSTHV